MPADQSEHLISDAFRHLNAANKELPAKLPAFSEHGLWAAWAALLLVAAFLTGVAWLVIDSDREAETIRLKQTTDLVAQSIEAQVLGVSEILQKMSLRLVRGQQGDFASASLDLAAQTLFIDRREVTELALVTEKGEVRRVWSSSTARAPSLFEGINQINDAHLLRAVRLAKRFDRSLSTPFYVGPYSQRIFVNIVTPSAIPDTLLMARIDLTRLLLLAQQRYADTGSYLLSFALNGRSIPAPVGSRGPSKPPVDQPELTEPIIYATDITLLDAAPEEEMSLVAKSYDHALFANNRVQYFSVGGLALMLLAAIGLVFYYQRQQVRSHRTLMAEYSLPRVMSESAVVGLRVTDLKGRMLYVNDTFPKIVGYPAKELIGQKPPYPYWAKNYVAELTERLLSATNHPEAEETLPVVTRFEAVRKNGEEFWAELRISPLLDDDGKPFGSIGALFDVTNSVLAQSRVEAANERFTLVVESMASAIAVLAEPNRDVLFFANRSYHTLFNDRPNGAAKLLARLEKAPPTVQSDGIFDEETSRWFDVRSQRIVWTRGETAVMVIATDITKRRELDLAREAQLRRAESTHRLVTMGEMASSLAHELNQPLAAIANYANAAATMLANGTLSKEREAQSYARIENQAQRAGRIIQRIRGFAKKTDAKLEPVAVETVIQETLELANIQARKLDSRIKLVIAPGLPLMMGDSVMLEQLLLNLLKNAMEACASSNIPMEERTIELHADPWEKNPERLQFQVVDHGPGIPEESRSKLFDAFYSTKSEGMGMGLNICRSIAELHGGELRMDPTPGGGSTFSFTVPFVKEAVTHAPSIGENSSQ